MDYNLPGSSVLGILQARNTGVGGHALLQGIFPTQGSKQRMLRLSLQAASSPLAPPGKPSMNANCYYYCHNDYYCFLNTKAFVTENKRKKPTA